MSHSLPNAISRRRMFRSSRALPSFPSAFLKSAKPGQIKTPSNTSRRLRQRQDRTVLAPGGGGENDELAVGELGHDGLLRCPAPRRLRRFHPRRPRRSAGRGGRARGTPPQVRCPTATLPLRGKSSRKIAGPGSGFGGGERPTPKVRGRGASRPPRGGGQRAGMGAPRYQVTGAGRSIGQSATIRPEPVSYDHGQKS